MIMADEEEWLRVLTGAVGMKERKIWPRMEWDVGMRLLCIRSFCFSPCRQVEDVDVDDDFELSYSEFMG